MRKLYLYNTLTRKKEIFKPIKDKKATLYTCGPTVYNYAHIGNLRTYIFEDILRRTLEYNGYKVKHVMNITDVGHLTSNADEGEDKLEAGAKREGKSVWNIAKFYTQAFLSDIKKLNIKKAHILSPATQNIKEQIKLIQKLFVRGLAYETDKAIYFDVYKFKNYTKLSRQKLSEKISGAREEVETDPQKKNPQDFVLWFKLAGRFKNHLMRWPSPWGKGFPGWHIECSAISTKFLGQPFDIHTGGIDHIPVHHTNEIAQSEGAYQKPLAKYWLHGEFLLLNESKMAKSKENFITLQTVIDKGFDALAFRYLVLTTHYRSKLNFTWKSLEAAQNALDNLYLILRTCDVHNIKKLVAGHIKSGSNSYQNEFLEAINNDLDTPRALAVIWRVIKDQQLPSQTKRLLLLKFDEVLGLEFNKIKPVKIPRKIRELAARREEFRSNKQFTHADALRKKIERLGYVVEDTPQGSKIKKR